VAKIRGDQPRDHGDLSLKKKGKKETAAKHKGRSRVALLKQSALTNEQEHKKHAIYSDKT